MAGEIKNPKSYEKSPQEGEVNEGIKVK